MFVDLYALLQCPLGLASVARQFVVLHGLVHMTRGRQVVLAPLEHSRRETLLDLLQRTVPLLLELCHILYYYYKHYLCRIITQRQKGYIYTPSWTGGVPPNMTITTSRPNSGMWAADRSRGNYWSAGRASTWATTLAAKYHTPP